MENDWAQDAFPAAIFPLPFRVLSLICLGILGWATNLHGLHALGLDAIGALNLRIHQSTRIPLPTNRSSGFRNFPHPSSSHIPIYRLFASCSVWCFLLWCTYRYATYENLIYVDVFKYIPAVAILGLLTGLFCPFEVLEAPHRDAFLLAIRRCATPILNHRILFCDVILADIFTSYAKVFGDLWLSFCMLMPGGSLLVLPTQDGWSRWMLPTLMSIPYIVRFRQCMVEYTASSNQSRKPLYNAIKYASCFPVMYLSAAQRTVIPELVMGRGERITHDASHGGHYVFRLWLLCAAVNSLYSFWWDITNDWGFDLLLPSRMKESRDAALQPLRTLMLPSLHPVSASVASSAGTSSVLLSDEDHQMERSASMHHVASRSYPFGLRSNLLLPLHYYPFIIVTNLILRLTWSIKLSPHLHSQSEGSGIIFWTEVAELIRRWMWVFVRVEWEIVKESGGRQKKIQERNFDEDSETVHSES